MNEVENLSGKTRVMLELQDAMNSAVDSDWRDHQREWYRAIWIECAELMDHYGGWKWWKHSEPDIPQVVLEIVDIWHFGLSIQLQRGGDTAVMAEAIVQQWRDAPPSLPFLLEVERLASAALDDKAFLVGSVANLMHACDHDFDDLYRAYVAKNVLNLFRQDHGYKSGEYVKIWNGREDNEVLADLIVSLDCDRDDFPAQVQQALEIAYQEVI